MNQILIAALIALANDKQVKSLKFDSKPRKEDIQAALEFWTKAYGPHYEEDDLMHVWTKDEPLKEQETIQPGGAWDADEQYDDFGEPIEVDEDDDNGGYQFYKNFDIEKGAFRGQDLQTLIKNLEAKDDIESERSYSYLTKYFNNGVLKIPPIIQINGMVADGFGRVFLAWALGLNKVKVVNYNM